MELEHRMWGEYGAWHFKSDKGAWPNPEGTHETLCVLSWAWNWLPQDIRKMKGDALLNPR